MSGVTLQEAIQIVEQLNVMDRLALIRHVQKTLPTESGQVTREMILARHQQRITSGAFEQVESLRNKYADPPLNITDEELRASIKEGATEWEKELDEFYGDN